MSLGKLKSNSKRKVYRKTPGGKTVIHYRNKKPSQAKCSMCGADLIGVPRATKAQLNNMPKTMKRPERPFGGVLCSACTKIIIKQEVREEISE
jgi:large subunit ribosomal protein L34e